jgi:hypothetical protein
MATMAQAAEPETPGRELKPMKRRGCTPRNQDRLFCRTDARNVEKPREPKQLTGPLDIGGLGRNRTTDTRIFNPCVLMFACVGLR